MKKNISCIYKITSPSGRSYVGSTKNFNTRVKYYIKEKCIEQIKLYASIKKYGWLAHTIEIIELCKVEKLFERERFWGDHYDVIGKKGLNCILPKGDESRAIYCEKTRKNISDGLKKRYKELGYTGKEKVIIDLLTGVYYSSRKELCELYHINMYTLKEKLGNKSGINNTQYEYADGSGNKAFQSFKPRINTKEVLNFKTGKTYRNISEASKSSQFSLQTLSRMLNGTSPNKSDFRFFYNDLSFYLEVNKKRKVISEEGRKNMSECRKGEKNNFFGKTHSNETKRKISETQKGRKHSNEHRKKVSDNNGRNMSKIVFDMLTGIFYNSVKELSDITGLNHSTMRAKLNGSLKNNTQYIYV